jgi:hypothetical protein
MTFVQPSSDLQMHWRDDVIEEEMHWKAIFILTAAGILFGSIGLWAIIQIGISLIMCTILTYTDIAIIGHNTNRVFGLDRGSSVSLRKMKTWKCKKKEILCSKQVFKTSDRKWNTLCLLKHVLILSRIHNWYHPKGRKSSTNLLLELLGINHSEQCSSKKRQCLASCYRFSCYYRFSDIAINSVNPSFIWRLEFSKNG